MEKRGETGRGWKRGERGVGRGREGREDIGGSRDTQRGGAV